MLSRERAHGVILSLAILCLGLGAAVVYLWQKPSGEFEALDVALQDPNVRGEVIDELVEQADAIFDAWPDPDVSRVLLPNLSREVRRRLLTSNEYGMPERPYAIPKEPGTVRVVLLGDSYVFGTGVAMDERLGVHLERFLRERVGGAKIECLHVGIPSWNITAECAYLRRQLHVLQPDLVIQVVVPNDLDDNSAVRGFGSQAAFTPLRVGGRIYRTYPRLLGFQARNPLLYALDHESRQRYAAAGSALGELAAQVRAAGGRYLLVLYWLGTQAIAREQFAAYLEPQEMVALPRALYGDPAYRVSRADGHWNAAGHERVAEFLYAAIERSGLLPALVLPPWPEASQIFEELTGTAEQEMQDDPVAALAKEVTAGSAIDFTALTEETASQVYGGIFPPGVAGPWVSVVLAKASATRLVIEGRGLPAPALDGAVVHVLVEGEQAGEFILAADQPFRWDLSVPAAVQGREFTSVQLQADDYVYGDADLRRALSYYLFRIALE